MIDGANVSLANGDVKAAHQQIIAAAKGRNVWVKEGGDLAGQFNDAGLLDGMIVRIGSVTLGQGKPLFPRRVPSPGLALVFRTQVGTGSPSRLQHVESAH
jgi:dihydrofolate reductase